MKEESQGILETTSKGFLRIERGEGHTGRFGGATTLGLENQVRLKASLYDTSGFIYY